MKKKHKNQKAIFIWLSIILALMIRTTVYAAPSILNVSYLSSAVQYEKYEITFDLSTMPTNPYDPDYYDVYAVFTSPTSTTYRQNAFLWIEATGACTNYGLESSPFDQIETVTLNESNKHWKIRFAAPETGSWSFQIIVQDNTTQTSSVSSTYNFSCSSGSNHGFVQLANNRYLEFSDGTQFFGIGLSHPYFSRTTYRGPLEYGTCEIKKVIDIFADKGINYFRFEINSPVGVNLIGVDLRDKTNYKNYFNQKDAWQFDEILNYATSNGIYIELAFLSHELFADGPPYGWCMFNDYNPFYSAVVYPPADPDSAGTLTSPLQFYGNTDAKRVMKNVARYIIARWGYSTNLLSIELMDEADRLDVLNDTNQCNSSTWIDPSTYMDTLNADMILWHDTMYEYFKEIDPFNHLITTGFAVSNYATNHDIYAEMDYTQTHNYIELANQNQNHEKLLFNAAEDFTDYYSPGASGFPKPYKVGETYPFASDFPMGRTLDPHYYCEHAAFWGAFFNGSFSIPSIWAAQDILDAADDAFDIIIGPSSFACNLPKLSEQYLPTYIEETNYDLVYLENINKDYIAGYYQDKNFKINSILYNPYNLLYLQDYSATYRPTLASSNPTTLTFQVLKKGDYSIKWFSSINGEQYGSAQTISSTTNGSQENVSASIPFALLNGKYGDAAFTITYDCESQWNTGVLNDNSPTNARSYSPVCSYDDHVFFIGTDNKVHAMYLNTYYWQETTLTPSISDNVNSNSDLVCDGNGGVYYFDTNKKIHMVFWDVTNWSDITLNSYSNLSPYSALQVNSAGTVVYFVGDDNRIHKLQLSGSVWNESTLNSNAPQNVIPKSDLVLDETHNRIFFTATDYRIHAMSRVFRTWLEYPLNSSALQNVRCRYDITLGAYVSNSSMALDKSNGNIFFVGSDSRIHEYYLSGTTWVETALNTSGPINVRNLTIDNRFFLTSDNSGKVYFIGSDNRIHQYFWNSTYWQEATNNSDDPTNVMAGIYYSDDNSALYYGATDHKIYSSYWGCNSLFKNATTSQAQGLVEQSELQKRSREFDILVYPNPVQDKMSIKINGGTDNNKSIFVFDLYGKVVKQANLAGYNSMVLDISDLSSGIYIIRVNDSGSISQTRFTKL